MLSEFSVPSLLPACAKLLDRLGQTITSAYTLAFQTHLFSILPASFARGVKALVAATLVRTVSQPSDQQDRPLWQAFDTLSLVERYETLIASVGYEYIEAHVLQTCAGSWEEPILANLRAWMIQKIVPWMVWPFARGATSGMIYVHLCIMYLLTL